MSIDREAVQNGLLKFDFALAYQNRRSGVTAFVKRHSEPLFERIRIELGSRRGGKLGDIVSAYIDCSIVPGRTALKGLCESRCLSEIAAESSGWTDVRETKDAKDWQTKLIDIAPNAAHLFAAQQGPQLLGETAKARNAAARYYELIGRNGSIVDRILRLKSKASQSQLVETNRILQERICMIPNGLETYELATLAIAVHCGDVDGDANWLTNRSTDIELDRALMIRLQLLASFISDPVWSNNSGGGDLSLSSEV